MRSKGLLDIKKANLGRPFETAAVKENLNDSQKKERNARISFLNLTSNSTKIYMY